MGESNTLRNLGILLENIGGYPIGLSSYPANVLTNLISATRQILNWVKAHFPWEIKAIDYKPYLSFIPGQNFHIPCS